MATKMSNSALYARAQAACEAAGLTFSRYPAHGAPGVSYLDISPAVGGWRFFRDGAPVSGRRGLRPSAMAKFLDTMILERSAA